MAENKDKNQPIAVEAKDLPLHCPQADAPLWARHPRVFLDVTRDGEARCPYCGAHYVLHGDAPHGH
ncbi:MAG: zinc-finger domain-containing protein [Uliginosibacterium sp.]|nr:zinc-finger domain-containing protein [Uliginosibacterium sp.]MBK9615932.1 zinc-finger domain-containing protein [Uliginosibacterium sp.]